MVKEIDDGLNRFVTRAREAALESAAVIVSGMALLVSILSLVLASVCLYIAIEAKQIAKDEAYSTQEEVEILIIYINNLHADLKARGFEPPLLPGEEK